MTYTIFLEAEVHAARKSLPGHVRQRIHRSIEQLVTVPRPAESETLTIDAPPLPPTIDVRRIRLTQWRIIYAVCDTEHWVWVLAIRRRPPYQYEDLTDLIRHLPHDG